MQRSSPSEWTEWSVAGTPATDHDHATPSSKAVTSNGSVNPMIVWTAPRLDAVNVDWSHVTDRIDGPHCGQQLMSVSNLQTTLAGASMV